MNLFDPWSQIMHMFLNLWTVRHELVSRIYLCNCIRWKLSSNSMQVRALLNKRSQCIFWLIQMTFKIIFMINMTVTSSFTANKFIGLGKVSQVMSDSQEPSASKLSCMQYVHSDWSVICKNLLFTVSMSTYEEFLCFISLENWVRILVSGGHTRIELQHLKYFQLIWVQLHERTRREHRQLSDMFP